MKKYFMTGLAAIFAVTLAAPAFAQDNVSGLGAFEGSEATQFKSLTANNNYFATKYLCKDATGTSSSISAAIADCCIAGDIWRATIFKGNKGGLFQNTANTSQFTAGSAAFNPDIYSPNATLFTGVKSIQVLATMGNQTPGGLPAGGTLRITTNGLGLTCDRKQLVNGSASF